MLATLQTWMRTTWECFNLHPFAPKMGNVNCKKMGFTDAKKWFYRCKRMILPSAAKALETLWHPFVKRQKNPLIVNHCNHKRFNPVLRISNSHALLRTIVALLVDIWRTDLLKDFLFICPSANWNGFIFNDCHIMSCRKCRLFRMWHIAWFSVFRRKQLNYWHGPSEMLRRAGVIGSIRIGSLRLTHALWIRELGTESTGTWPEFYCKKKFSMNQNEEKRNWFHRSQ